MDREDSWEFFENPVNVLGMAITLRANSAGPESGQEEDGFDEVYEPDFDVQAAGQTLISTRSLSKGRVRVEQVGWEVQVPLISERISRAQAWEVFLSGSGLEPKYGLISLL